ncbi:MAG TPA: MBL fold metallo-hydrolase [Gemmatimonadaceae bacterium]|jgi:phosphoribosyl 1,2-cyclic phosphodiesterase
MTFRLKFWGTRGSIPSPGAHTVRYGGNTPCVEVRTETDGLIILDAGTGIRGLGLALADEARRTGRGIAGDIFLTHAHWDHIQGIPFFTPMFEPGNQFMIWAPKMDGTDIDEVLHEQMAPAVFPVAFGDVPALIDFCTVAAAERRAGNGFAVRSFAVQHPGGALGYRFEGRSAEGPSFVYISDNELGSPDRYGMRPEWRQELVEFVRGAALLVHDATYTADEYERHGGWGHSTFDDAVALALDAGVPRLVLFHHKPERSDDELDVCLAACRSIVERRDATLEVIAAAEGATVSV